MEVTTVVGDVIDSGAIDVDVEDNEQQEENPSETQQDKRSSAEIQAGARESPTQVSAKGDGDAVEVQERSGDVGYINKKGHQGTQTSLSNHRCTEDVVGQEPAWQTSLWFYVSIIRKQNRLPC